MRQAIFLMNTGERFGMGSNCSLCDTVARRSKFSFCCSACRFTNMEIEEAVIDASARRVTTIRGRISVGEGSSGRISRIAASVRMGMHF